MPPSEPSAARDRAPGMGRPIARRDFLNGAALALGAALAGPAFAAMAADIVGVTVNRWPHGYAYEYNPLFDPDWDDPDQLHVVGRAPFGRIVIANSDSGAGGYSDVAIDQAWRALLTKRWRPPAELGWPALGCA